MYCSGPHRLQIFFGKTQPKGTITIAAASRPSITRAHHAFPSEHLTPFFVNTDIAQALLSINGAASHLPQRGM